MIGEARAGFVAKKHMVLDQVTAPCSKLYGLKACMRLFHENQLVLGIVLIGYHVTEFRKVLVCSRMDPTH
jgi:hypothetical protein